MGLERGSKTANSAKTVQGSKSVLSPLPVIVFAIVQIIVSAWLAVPASAWTQMEMRGSWNGWVDPAGPPFELRQQSDNAWFTILYIPRDMSAFTSYDWKFTNQAGATWRGEGNAWGTRTIDSGATTNGITTSGADMTVSFAPGWYNVYNAANDDNYTIGSSGRILADGKLYNVADSEAQKEWPNFTILGVDTRNSENDTFYALWDTSFLYLGFNGFTAASQDFFVYMDVNGEGAGTDVIQPWSGDSTAHVLPFMADYALMVEAAAYKSVRNYTATGWNDPGDGGNIFRNSVGTISEFKIKWSDIGGVPSILRMFAFVKWEDQGNMTTSFPTYNPASNSSIAETIPYYFQWSVNVKNNPVPRTDSTIRSGGVRINEVLWNAATESECYIELYNPRNYVIDISNYAIYDVETQDSYTFTSGTGIRPRSFVVFHPQKGTDYTDVFGIRHFYAKSNWNLGGLGTADDDGAIELYRSPAPSVTNLLDFVTWSNNGVISNAAWDDTAVRLGIWTANTAVDVVTGSANADRPIIRRNDGVDSDGVATNEWIQVGADSAYLAGISNNAGAGPTSITSVAFKDSDFSTARTFYYPGETIYVLVTATSVNTGNTEATVVEFNGGGKLDIVAYENGLNSTSFRGVLRAFSSSASTLYSPAEDSITLPSSAAISARSKTDPSKTASALIDSIPYLSFSSYSHKNRELSLYFSRPIDTSTLDVSKFAIQQTASAGMQLLTGATIKNGPDSNGFSIIVTTAQRNTIATWEDSTLFVSISSGAGSGTSTIALPVIDSTAAARAIDSYVSGYDTGVKINEVYPQGDTTADPAFIELFFRNDVELGWVDLRNFYFAERADTRDFYINASVNMGPGDYFVIYRDSGTNKTDMSAGVADTGIYYSGVKFFTYTNYNQVAMYKTRVTQDSSTILDFITWRRSNYAGLLDMPETNHAILAGIWTARDSFTYSAGSDYNASAKSISLINNGADTNQSADWIEQSYTPNSTNRVNEPPAINAVDIIQVLGPPEFVPGDSIAFKIKYSDVNGADSIIRFDFRISNGADTIWYYSFAGQAPVAVQGSSYVVGAVSIDTSYQNNDVICTWTLELGWNFVDAANYLVGARGSDNYPETGAWTDSTITHIYDNDLVLSGTLAGSGSANGSIGSGIWAQANQTVTWTGLTIYFQNTTVSPKSYFCTFAITDDDSRQTTQTGSASLNHAKLTDTQYDLSESVAITLLDVPSPGTFDISTKVVFPSFRLDDSAPIIRVLDETYVFKADTNTRAPALKAHFLSMDSQTLIDTIQYQLGGTWFDLSTGDIDTFNRPWFLSNAAYVKLDTAAINTVALRVYDQAGWVTTANLQIYYEPITINGDITDWQGDEKMQVDSYQNIWFMLAWDDTNLYLSYQPKSLENDGDGDFFVYFDVRPNTGSLTTINWGGGGTHQLPGDTGMRWDAAFCLDDNLGAVRFELQLDTGAGFKMIEDHTTFSGQAYIAYSGNPTTEVRLRWDVLTAGQGKPDSFNVVAFQQYESSGNLFTSYPTANPGAGLDTDLLYAYRYPSSDDTVAPNSAVKSLINVDAGLAEWPDTTILPAWRAGLTTQFRVTWDATFLYFGFSRNNAFPNDVTDYNVIFVHIDTTPLDNVDGSDTSVGWNGTHTLPFKAQYCFIYSINHQGGGGDYTNLRKWNGATFAGDQPWSGAAAKSTTTGIAEFSIPLADLGDTDIRPFNKFRMVLYSTNGADANNLMWAVAPNANPSGNRPVKLTSYIQYDSMDIAIVNPGHKQWTRTTAALPAGDTRVPPFTPYIDGTKDPGWGDTPDAKSPYGAWPYDTHMGAVSDGRKFPAGRTDSIWITNDIASLYIGWHAHGDHYDDANTNSSHYGFIFFSDSYPAGTAYDPWKGTNKTTRVYDHAADVWVMGFATYGQTNFSGMTLYKDAGRGQWDTGTALKSGTDFRVNTSNYWGELKIPLSTLALKPGDTVGIIYFARHESGKDGISDLTPFQGSAVSDWSNTDANISASIAKVYKIQTSSNANVVHKPNTEPVAGKGKMRAPLVPLSSDAVVITVSGSPVSNYSNLFLFYTKDNWATQDTVALISAFTSGTEEYFQCGIPAAFSKGDTVDYYIKIDESVDNFVYGNDTFSYVTSVENTARTNAFRFIVINASPSPPDSAVLTPKVPLDASSLQMASDGSIDKDGDTRHYVFSWYRNDLLIPELVSIDSTSPYVSSVSADSTFPGDNWYCDVSVGDGRDTSATLRSNAVNINEFNVWSGTAPIEVNTAAVSDSEWIWTDKINDQRLEANLSWNFDITEVRLELDTVYLHFLFTLRNISNANYPNIAVSFDTDFLTGSGNPVMGDESVMTLGDSYDLPAAWHESLLVVHTHDLNSPIIEVLQNGVWSETTAGVVIDTTSSVIRGRVPRSMIGLPSAGTVRCAIASFKNRMGKASEINSTVEFPVGDALDAVSIAAPDGTASNVNDKTRTINAYDEDISDGDIDFWFQLRFDTFAGPLRNYRPNKVVNPSPANGGSTANLRPTFSWSMTTDTDPNDTVTSYLLEIGTSQNLEATVEYRINFAGRTTSFTPSANLLSDSYYWRVRARDRSGVLSDSTIWSFTITAPTIGVSRPLDINNENNVGQFQDRESADDTIYFQWAPATHSKNWVIQNYAIEISEKSSFDTVIVADTLIGTTAGCTTNYTIPAAYRLDRGKTYYARIRAGDTAATQNWSPYSQPSDGIFYSMRTVDGDSTDWAGTLGVSRNNEAYIAASREGGWRDWLGDTRADNAANKNYLDLDEFRVSSDSYNLYFYIRFNQWQDGSPYIQIALDVNQNSIRRVFQGTGTYAEDDFVNSNVAREFIILCRTGNDDVRVVNADFTTQGYGRYKESAADRSVELAVPLSMVGGIKEYTADTVNITAAIWWNNNGNVGQYTANNSNVVDAITHLTFTWNEVSDNVIDYWLAVGFDTLSQVNGIKIETAPHTPPTTNSNPGTSYYGGMRDYIIYNIWVDRFWSGLESNPPQDPDMTGGDFQGMMDQSQYFNDLGINAFQLSPMFDYGWGAWGYNQHDLYRVQGSFVSQNWSQWRGWEDYVKMVKHFKRRNISMGIDWIPGQIYGDNNSGGTISHNTQMWYGERFGGRRVLQYVSDGRQFFVDHTRFMYAVGTTLFRVDNPKFYPDPYEQGLPFTAYWNEQVKTFAPDLYSYGEIPDAPNVIGAFVNDGERLTGCLDFNSGYTVKSWANDGGGTSGGAFKDAWEGNHSSYNGSALPVMVNYYENHDHDRAYHSMSDWMDWNGSIGDMQTLMMWEAGGPGNPCIFYGDERVMMGKKETTFPGWEYTTSTGKFGNTRAFAWDYSGATGAIQGTVSYAMKARQVFAGLRYDQASMYWLEAGAGKPISFRRGSGSDEEVIVLINPNDGGYTFNGVNTSAANTWYKDWFTDGELQTDGNANFNFTVAANYAAFLKRNRFGRATLNVTVRNNGGRLRKALVDVGRKACWTKETNTSGQATVTDIVTAKSGTTQRQVRIWYPGYKAYDVAWNFTDGDNLTFEINLDTHASSGVDISAPAAPNGLTAVARDQGVVLDWSDNTESDIESYFIYRSTTPNNANATMIMEVMRSTYWDNNLDANSGLTNGVAYYYKLKARDYNDNVSGFSKEIAVTPNKVTVVLSVDMTGSGFSNIKDVYVKGNSYALGRFDFNTGWKPADIDPLVKMTHVGNNIWEKSVEMDPGMNINYLFVVNYNNGATWYDEFGIWNGYSYENARGWTSPLAAGDTVYQQHVWMAGGNAAPQAPKGLTAVGQNASVKLGWALNLENDVVKYELWRSPDNVTFNVIGNVDKSIINYTDVGLTNYQTYYYKMKAADNANNFSAFSSTVSAIPTPAADTVAPAKPTGATVSNAGLNSALLQWNYNTEGDLAGYNVYRGVSANFALNASTKLNIAIIPVSFKPKWIDSTAQVGVTYYYAVTAVDDFKNESDSSTLVSAKLARITFQVDMGNVKTNGNVKIMANDNHITWSGKSMTDSGVYVWLYKTDMIVGAALQYKYMTDTSETKFTTTSTNREITIPDALENTQIDDWQEFPDAVTGVSATADSGAAWIFWTANTSDQDLDGYNVYKQDASGGFTKMNSTVIKGTNKYKITGLTNGVIYSFAVRAIDAGVLTLESPNSNIVNVTPKGYVNVDFRN